MDNLGDTDTVTFIANLHACEELDHDKRKDR